MRDQSAESASQANMAKLSERNAPEITLNDNHQRTPFLTNWFGKLTVPTGFLLFKSFLFHTKRLTSMASEEQ
jgi:hypothetical protein